MAKPRNIVIPFRPRKEQRALWADRTRFNVRVCHRRFGKTVLCVNELIRDLAECRLERPRAAYIAPLYRQAKQIAWDYAKHYTAGIPGRKTFESELRIDLPGEARLQLFGADNPDALRGIYLDSVVLDEHAQMPPSLWDDVIRPLLSDRKGRATFIGTPKGRNKFFKLYRYAAAGDDPEWSASLYRASETDILPADELESARRQMPPNVYEQEFECSFEAAIAGAYYGDAMKLALDQGRITRVRYDPAVRVETWWDLGIGDKTAIWWVQRVGNEVHAIDYYENEGEPIRHYASILREKAAQWEPGGDIYDDLILPHDARARELISGVNRCEALEAQGFGCTVIGNHKVEDGIEAVRQMFPRVLFDADRCVRGIECLRQYRKDWDEMRQAFREKPRHDEYSHGADAFRMGAMHRPVSVMWSGPIQYPESHVSHAVV